MFLRGFIVFLVAILLAVMTVTFFRYSYYQSFLEEAKQSFENANDLDFRPLDELPLPVRRYLEFSGGDRMEHLSRIRLEQSGRFRMWPKEEWFPIRATQFYTTNPPALHWHGEIQMMGGAVTIAARDLYRNGKGNMRIKLYSGFTLGDVYGKEIDQGSLLRYVSEMMWFPPSLRGKNIVWGEETENSVKMKLIDSDLSVEGTFFFQEDGSVSRFEAMRYFDDGTGKNLRLLPWGGRVLEYGMRGGLKIPVRGTAYWIIDGKEFSYGDFIIDAADFDASLP